MMIGEVCHDIKNYFCYDRIFGKFKVEGGKLRFSDDTNKTIDLAENQYFRLAGSIFNDTVWQWHNDGIEGLQDEGEFMGAIWKMAIPKDFLNLVADIEQWQAKYGAIDSPANSPFTSESFGGYSYSKALGGGSDGSTSVTWQNAFASRLNKWRKILL